MARTLVVRPGVYSTDFRTLGIVRVCAYTTRERRLGVCISSLSTVHDRSGQAFSNRNSGREAHVHMREIPAHAIRTLHKKVLDFSANHHLGSSVTVHSV